jgi:NitT/TauT family transport system ATP-binding protein
MSRNPGRIAEIIEIDIPRPRPLSVRNTPEFGKYAQQIRHLFASLGVVRSE